MNEKTKSIGFLALSFSLLCLAISIVYIAWEAHQWRKDLPEILRLTGDTADKITPAVTNVSEIGKLVPPILEEVSASRKLVEELLEEVKITREQIPGIIKEVKPITQQVENTAKQLPKVIDPVLDEVEKTRKTIPDILEEIRKTNITIEKAIVEVRQTREALPGIMDRADQIVLNAQDAGKEAGKGVISGIIGGVISTPANVVGGVRKGAASLLSPQERERLTSEDIALQDRKILELANKGKVRQVATWENKKSSNSGKITLEEKYKEGEKECRKFKIDIYLNKKGPQTTFLKGCQQPDGTWIVEREGMPEK